MIAHHQICIVELPPRARRIPSRSKQVTRTHGTTSACAENTRRRGRWGFSHRNYLRVRGEYPPVRSWQPPLRELPPRARRILLGVCIRWGVFGTTSACAENTPRLKTATRPPWNYLRVRGEYGKPGRELNHNQELPPRARRIRHGVHDRARAFRTTSACAENTPENRHGDRGWWNYLRVRGEYFVLGIGGVGVWELPPRARRIPSG